MKARISLHYLIGLTERDPRLHSSFYFIFGTKNYLLGLTPNFWYFWKKNLSKFLEIFFYLIGLTPNFWYTMKGR